MKELDMRDPLLWICGPIPAEFIGQLGESAAIYYCADEYSAAPHAPVRVVRALEKHALRSADLTITVSKSLLEAKEEDARRIALLPHGVDAGHFGKALDPETPVPPDIARLPKPVVGYYGLLNERIDWRLLVWLAAQLPAWSFALIGPVAARPIRNLPQNVHLLGPRPYSELPGYLRGFDVAIVPYVPDDTFVRHSSPLKVLELLAAGRPIVTSSIPAVRTQYQGLVGVADTKEAFLAAIQDAASGAGGDITSAGCRLARAMSWDRRAGEALSLLEPVLGVGQSIGAATACTR